MMTQSGQLWLFAAVDNTPFLVLGTYALWFEEGGGILTKEEWLDEPLRPDELMLPAEEWL